MLFEAQPAMVVPYTASEAKAKTKSSPKLGLATCSATLTGWPNRSCRRVRIGGATGTTTKSRSAGTNTRPGAMLKSSRAAPSGVVSSLKRNFTASATKCGMPKVRTPRMLARLGPMRSCIAALHLRSAMVKRLAKTISTTTIRLTALKTPPPPLKRRSPTAAKA